MSGQVCNDLGRLCSHHWHLSVPRMPYMPFLRQDSSQLGVIALLHYQLGRVAAHKESLHCCTVRSGENFWPILTVVFQSAHINTIVLQLEDFIVKRCRRCSELVSKWVACLVGRLVVASEFSYFISLMHWGMMEP